MKQLVKTLFIISLLVVPSCDFDKFAAGSYPYAERIRFNCSNQFIIQQLAKLKATNKFSSPAIFADGVWPENNSYYNFYFPSQNKKFIAFLSVIGNSKFSTVLLIAVKNFAVSSKWKDLNHNLERDKQDEVLRWFNQEIKPVLVCQPLLPGSLH